jgi:hypothetical protein
MESIAQDMGVSVQKLKADNEKNIADFTRLYGRFLEICNIQGVQRALVMVINCRSLLP